jgi:GntR family transcriptional regulator
MLKLAGSLNSKQGLPLYQQLKSLLLKSIQGVDAGTALPTELAIADFYGVSRITARQAVLDLVQEGICYRMKGKGTFISNAKISQDFAKQILSFNEEMLSKGLTPSTKILALEVQRANEETAQALAIQAGTELVYMKRLRSANGDALVLVDSWIPYSVGKQLLERNMEVESLYAILAEQEETRVRRVIRYIEATLAGEDDAQFLNILPTDPIQLFRFTAFSENQIPVEYSISRYRADRNSFSIEITL